MKGRGSSSGRHVPAFGGSCTVRYRCLLATRQNLALRRGFIYGKEKGFEQWQACACLWWELYAMIPAPTSCKTGRVLYKEKMFEQWQACACFWWEVGG